MQADIIRRIDTLVDMAGVTSNIDTLKAELKEIEKESNRLKTEHALFTDGNIEDKYFKASEKQVDENIKVSLEAKIKKQEKSIHELQKEIDEAVKNETRIHESVSKTKEEMAASEEYIKVVESRLASLKDDMSAVHYKDILEEENKKLDTFSSSLDELKKDYQEALERLNYLNLAKEEMVAKLESDKKSLAEVKANLINPSSYIDNDLKEIDEERIETIKKRLFDLDKRRLEIITDPVMIAEEAKNLLIDDDRTSALSKVKELVTIVKSKPFMDIASGANLSATLQEELENAITERDEFAAMIDEKDYMGVDEEAIEARKQYVEQVIADLQAQIESLRNAVVVIDQTKFAIVNEKLNDAIQLEIRLEQNSKEYEDIIFNDDEEKTPKRRAVLSAAFQKKQEELEIVKQLILSYREDQKKLIEQTNTIENGEIVRLEKEIEAKQAELKLLEKLTLHANKTRDVLAIENDKKKLKELDDQVKSIQHRQKYGQTPEDIYDEIEMSLGTFDEVIEEVTESAEEETFEEPVLNYNYDLNDIEVKDLNEKEEVSESIVEETIVTPEEVEEELPVMEEVEVESERLKVIHVEPVTETENNDATENPFIIGDYKDDDYLDVDRLFQDSGVL